MKNFVMNSDDTHFLKLNLIFSLPYPIYKNCDSALNRLNDLHSVLEKLERTKENAQLARSIYNECDFILNTLEGYDW